MELVLHDIDELERLAKELAAITDPLARDSYEKDCAYFLTRIARYIAESDSANKAHLHGKLTEVKTQLNYLLRNKGSSDLSRHRLIIANALGVIYKTLRGPAIQEAEALFRGNLRK